MIPHKKLTKKRSKCSQCHGQRTEDSKKVEEERVKRTEERRKSLKWKAEKGYREEERGKSKDE